MVKKLTKSKNKKIFGVCGGLAEYLDCDPTWIRLIALILAIGFGVGILLYLVAAIILPSAE